MRRIRNSSYGVGLFCSRKTSIVVYQVGELRVGGFRVGGFRVRGSCIVGVRISTLRAISSSSSTFPILISTIGSIVGAVVGAVVGAIVETIVGVIVEAVVEAIVRSVVGVVVEAIVEAIIRVVVGAIIRIGNGSKNIVRLIFTILLISLVISQIVYYYIFSNEDNTFVKYKVISIISFVKSFYS